MSFLTFVTAAVVVYGLMNRAGYGRALGLGGATAAGSAIVIGSVAVPTFYAVAIGAAAGIAVQTLINGRFGPAVDRPLPPGASLFILCFIWSTLVTLVAPLLFDGLVTVTPRSTQLVAGSLTSSNVAQISYFFLGICVLVFIARSPGAKPSILALSVGTSMVLSTWRYLSEIAGIPFPEGVFDNSPAFAYVETAAGGLERFRGILTEPAGLASVSLVCIAYMLMRSVQVRGLRRVGCLALAGISLYLGVISTSTTFVVAGVVTAVIAAVSWLLAFLSRRTAWSRLVAVMSCVFVVVALYVLPLVFAFVAESVNAKIDSTSYTQRSSANADSLQILLETWGFGVGLGSARASSFLPTLLSATGIIGSLLYAAAFVPLLVFGSRVRAYRPVVWALIALMVSKVAAGPDLSDSTGVLWISLGLLSKAVIELRAKERGSVADDLIVPSSGRPR